MAAFYAEVMLTRSLRWRYARAADEAASLVREALHASGDIARAFEVNRDAVTVGLL